MSAGYDVEVSGIRVPDRPPETRLARGAMRPALLLLAVGCVLALTVLTGLIAYWTTFSQYHAYDDTGFFTETLRLFSLGRPLYDAVFTPMGPLFFELFGGLFALMRDVGVNSSTDLAYFITTVLWTVTALVIGLGARALTGSWLLALLAQVVAFAVLWVSGTEPMTPDLFVTTLAALAMGVAAWGLPRRPWGASLALGLLVGAIAATKINSGAFAFLAVVFALAFARRPGPGWLGPRAALALRVAAAVAIVAFGPVLLSPDWSWSWRYSLLVGSGSLALVVVTAIGLRRVRPVAGATVPWRPLAGAFIAVVVVSFGLIVALGSSPGRIVDTLIVNGARQRLVDPDPLLLSGFATAFAPVMAAVALGVALVAFLARRSRARLSTTAQFALGVAAAAGRGLAGFVILASVLRADFFQSYANAQFAYALPLAWVVALAPAGDAQSEAERFVRLFVPTLAIINGLFAYPVAGTQTGFAAAPFVLCGVLCLADGIATLRGLDTLRAFRIALVPGRGRHAAVSLGEALAAFALVGVLVLMVVWTDDNVVRPLRTQHATYKYSAPLPFYGASDVRTDPQSAAMFAKLVPLIRARCGSLITMPGLGSLSLWSGVPPVSGQLLVGPWWFGTPPQGLRDALAAARAAPRLCFVRADTQLAAWNAGRPTPEIPLVRYLQTSFRQVASFGAPTVGTYELMVRRRG